jgi:1,4-dihydroxy-2-naphthoate polyprenyltransferase
MASRAYSYRKIRLKQYPFIGYLTVVVFQGAVTYWLVYHGSSEALYTRASTKRNGCSQFIDWRVLSAHTNLSAQSRCSRWCGNHQLQIRLSSGTFLFCAVVYTVAMAFLRVYAFFSSLLIAQFFVLLIFFSPILVYFFWWAAKVWEHTEAADFTKTMRMNILASSCTNLGFITVLILNHLE